VRSPSRVRQAIRGGTLLPPAVASEACQMSSFDPQPEAQESNRPDDSETPAPQTIKDLIHGRVRYQNPSDSTSGVCTAWNSTSIAQRARNGPTTFRPSAHRKAIEDQSREHELLAPPPSPRPAPGPPKVPSVVRPSRKTRSRWTILSLEKGSRPRRAADPHVSEVMVVNDRSTVSAERSSVTIVTERRLNEYDQVLR